MEESIWMVIEKMTKGKRKTERREKQSEERRWRLCKSSEM